MTEPSHYSEARHHLDTARIARRGLSAIPSALIGLGYAVLHVGDAMYDVLGELADLRAERAATEDDGADPVRYSKGGIVPPGPSDSDPFLWGYDPTRPNPNEHVPAYDPNQPNSNWTAADFERYNREAGQAPLPSMLSEPDVPVQWGEGVPWTDDQWVDDDDRTPRGDDDLDETVPRPVYRPSWASASHPLEDVDTTAIPDHAIADPRWLNLLRDDV